MEKCNICLKECTFVISVEDSDESNIKWFTKLQYIVPELEWLHEYMICTYCTKQLGKVWEFKKFVISLEKDRRNEVYQVLDSNFKDNFDIDCFYDEKTFTFNEQLQLTQQDNKPQTLSETENCNLIQESFTCYNCNTTFNSKDSLVYHIENEHKTVEIDSNTTNLKKQLKYAKYCKKYMEDNHLNDLYDTQMNSSTLENYKDKINEYFCEKCSMQFTSNQEASIHDCSKSTSEFGEVTESTSVVKKRRGRKPLRKFTCEICNKEFDYVKLVYEHYESLHAMDRKSVKPYSCEKCDMRFATSANLDQHRNYHNKNRSQICSACGKGFITKSDLTVHEYTHYNRRNYKCTLCDKAFNTNKNLRTHILVVHTDRSLWKYGCSICEKRFPLKTNYDQHLRRHTGEKEYICHICKKPFISKSELQRHVHMHSNIRAFKCSNCDKEYKEKRTYLTHLAKKHGIGNVKIAVREKKYVCHICPSQFYDKQKLVRHIYSHSGIKPFPCHMCDKKFSDKSYLQNHLKATHKTERLNIDIQ